MERLDQLASLRMLGDQNLDGLGPGSTRVLVAIPLRRRHLGKEQLHLVRVIEQLPVQVAWIPVDQNAPEIEDNRSRARQPVAPADTAPLRIAAVARVALAAIRSSSASDCGASRPTSSLPRATTLAPAAR